MKSLLESLLYVIEHHFIKIKAAKLSQTPSVKICRKRKHIRLI
jgi:hypothetical protein